MNPVTTPSPYQRTQTHSFSTGSSGRMSANDSSGNEISFVDTKYLCVGIVDIVNSTKITADIGDSENVAKYYSIFINTMAVIARNFGAEVIKNVGDSVIFFFPRHLKLRLIRHLSRMF